MKLEARMHRSIRRRRGNVILRSELAGLASAAQITRALKSLQTAGLLIRIGAGVYAKTRTSSITGATIPAGSLETLAAETFRKLGVSVSAGRAAAAYNEGRTSQLPGAFVVNTGRRRIRRRILVGGRAVSYERRGQRPAFNLQRFLERCLRADIRLTVQAGLREGEVLLSAAFASSEDDGREVTFLERNMAQAAASMQRELERFGWLTQEPQ